MSHHTTTMIPTILKLAGDFITEIEASDGTDLKDVAARATQRANAALCESDIVFYKLVLNMALVHKRHQTEQQQGAANLH